jgi:SAM-dependent methyltransferase
VGVNGESPTAPGRSGQDRLAREIEHGRKIASNAETIWFWESPAGRRRADRRAELFVEHGALAPGRRALELGCGTGVFLERVARCGAEIRGLDLSEDLLEKARERVARLPNVALDRGNAEAMPYPESHFDAVYGSSILHHLDLAAALAESRRVLRPGGRVVFAEPNILNPQVLLMFRFPPLKERFGVSPDEMAFSRFRARRALERAGFLDVAVEPFDFLHPSIPQAWVERGLAVSRALERMPLVREIAGSLLMRARRA